MLPAAPQAYQAELIKHHVETLRRIKYRPAGGFCVFCLADGAPGVTWSVVDDQRVPKAGYHALAAACAPVIVVAERPAAAYGPGEAIALDIHVVSDLRAAVTDAIATARLVWPGGEHLWTWDGEIPPDSCVRVGTVQALAPEVPGPLTLELTLDGRDLKCTNSYTSRVESALDEAAQ